MKKSTYLYLVSTINAGKEVSPCKIGISTNLSSRLQMLQCGSAHKLRFRQIWNPACLSFAARVAEAQFHAVLSAHRLNGEWFDLSPEDLEHMIDFAFAYAYAKGGGTSDGLAWGCVARSKCLDRTHDRAGRQIRAAA